METQSTRDSGIWPYALPYLGFGVVLSLLGGSTDLPWVAALAQVGIPMGLLAWFAWRGAYPELSGFRPSLLEALSDIAVGLLIAAVWIGPFLIFTGLDRPGAEAHFDPQALGSETTTLALRFIGFALVTPFMEELFVRSFLLRFLDVFDTDADFRRVPIGIFAWRSFIGTVLWFTVTHQTWEWIVALPTGILFNLWLYRRRHMGSVILAHAVANAAIFFLVVMRAGANPDLWIFL